MADKTKEQTKEQIAELLYRSAYALDHKDLDGLAACFHQDARFNLTIDGVAEASEFKGLEAIMSLMKGALDVQTDVRRHSISNVWYRSFTEEAATVVSYLTLMATEHGETKLITTGVYTDQVTKVDGTWVVVDRDLYLDRAY
jgi:3-phenylpropionate/cinnamic acid dioxygenase small subunit